MDPDAPYNVARGTIITCLSIATLSSAYGTLKGQPIGPLATSSALNSGIVAATFFSLREYVVSPVLVSTVGSGQFARRRLGIEKRKIESPRDTECLSWGEMRMEKLPDTAISGALAGSLFNYWKRGRPGVVPGAITTSLLCSVLQLGFNELRIWRVKYVSRQQAGAEQRLRSSPGATVTLQDGLQDSASSAEPAPPIWERLLLVFGIHKMSTEEYLVKLKRQRADALRRIVELEAEEALAKEDSQSEQAGS